MAAVLPTSFQSLESLSPEDKVLFNCYGRGETILPPFTRVHHALEAIASQYPKATAVRHFDGTTISYGELDRRANILANELRTRYGFKQRDRAVLVYSRSIEMVIFIFAVLKAGGQYVPQDGGIVPPETLSYVISDSAARVVLCLPKFQEKVRQSLKLGQDHNVSVVSIDTHSDLWASGNATSPAVNIQPYDGAYIIYTSGTTGRPKGVDVTHSNVTNTLLLEPAKLGITVGKNVAQQLNVAFDMCAWEILATIMNGGTLHPRGSGNELWAECLRRVDIVVSTPSVALKRFPNHEDFPNLKTIVVGGEPCPKPLADHWAPHASFINICGPTEITILNTAHLHKLGGPLTIGKPNPNTTVYVLDDDENPVKIGEPGVMWVGGAGVSRGYLNLPELTAARYKYDKFVKDGSMMFNTGDLGRWDSEGRLETLGRRDDQVKINGFRVELDGVSRAIESHPDIVKGCALKIDDSALWGFYAAPTAIDEEELRKTVAVSQPFYAIPKIWWYLGPTIPLTANGKIDKRALRDLAANADAGSVSSVPLTPEESDANTSGVSSSGSSSRSTDLEKAILQVTTIEIDELPPKNGVHGWRWLRHTGLSAYRKLFGVLFIANLVAFAVLVWQSRNANYELPLGNLATAVSANLLASVLLRQDYLVNLIFWLATRLPTSTPLSIRRHFARVYHYGGVHSGASVAASAWWIVFTISATARFAPASPSQPSERIAVLVLTYLILAFLVGILIMAYPSIRAKMHDQFEWTHRFAGWTVLALVWAHLVVVTAATSSSKALGPALAQTPTLYLLALTTLSIAAPWLRLRRVKVVAEPLSTHAVRLHFDFKTPRQCSSLGVRITDRPMVEWHAFAAIPEPDGKPGLSLLVSRAGDWTGKIIDNPPTTLWTRGEPASGVLAIAPLFRKVVLVATGSGIGPCLPVIMERKVPCRILWSTKNPLKTYGQGVIDEVKRCDDTAVIWDTDNMGRPDLVKLAWQLYNDSGAECVCIISNARTTKRVVYQLEARGIPAFGPIWDS
ncbi:putative Nonribosomal peptide synthetase [Podospora australis]|uniref:Nonribosomal peptide synthetase n=1 Tax=Podospora australis TaxID=1536484 RepID=A0AAN6X3X3_9PEZI|nr:putative Nonribosomal peptide synthetase [Podospora australis]